MVNVKIKKDNTHRKAPNALYIPKTVKTHSKNTHKHRSCKMPGTKDIKMTFKKRQYVWPEVGRIIISRILRSV